MTGDGDVFSQGCNAFIVLFHKLFLSNCSPSRNGGLLVPHATSLQREAGVFLSMLILLPSTYISRPAWEVGEQERHHPLPALSYLFCCRSHQRRIAIGACLPLIRAFLVLVCRGIILFNGGIHCCDGICYCRGVSKGVARF